MIEHRIIDGIEIQNKNLQQLVKRNIVCMNDIALIGVFGVLTDEELCEFVNSEFDYCNFNKVIRATYSTIFFRE